MHNSKQPVSDALEKLSVSAPPGRVVYLREHPPSHCSLKITSFSLLAETNVEKYDSGIFEADGFKWRLSLYPNGDKKRGGAGHLSLYLAIEETDEHEHGWEVNAVIKLFIFDQIRNAYLTIQDAKGAVSRFHEEKSEFGFSKLMMLDTFYQTSKGYLVKDTCFFGAEVFVVAPSGNWESLAMVKPKRDHNKHTWKIGHFSKEEHNYSSVSHPFSIGDQHWKIKIYPKGDSHQRGKCLSVFLELVGAEHLPPKRKIYASFKLRVLDQLHNHHHEKPLTHWFDCHSVAYGCSEFLKLKDLHTSTKGLLHNNRVNVEVEIHVMSEVKVMSEF